MRPTILAASLTMLLVSAPADACRVNRPPAQRLFDGRKSGAITAVALVTISKAAYTHEPVSDAHPWAAWASVEQVVQGAYPSKTVRFERGWGSAACDDGLPPPKAGERWVVYFWKRAEGDLAVWQAYPLAVAKAADPMLTNVR